MNPQILLHPDPAATPVESRPDSLFERAGWFYAFLRTRVFRNDAVVIARSLQLARKPAGSSGAPVLVEVGCGPGFYACHLADRFPRWTVLGLDHSPGQLRRARETARRASLDNCSFEWSDATALERADASVDGIFTSRLFTVLEDRHLATVLSEMHRVLRPGGRCLMAEPRSPWRAAIPLKLLWWLARLSPRAANHHNTFREPRRPTVLAADQFRALVTSQPWGEIRCWEDGHYQYALVRKREDVGVPANAAGDPVRPA